MLSFQFLFVEVRVLGEPEFSIEIGSHTKNWFIVWLMHIVVPVSQVKDCGRVRLWHFDVAWVVHQELYLFLIPLFCLLVLALQPFNSRDAWVLHVHQFVHSFVSFALALQLLMLVPAMMLLVVVLVDRTFVQLVVKRFLLLYWLKYPLVVLRVVILHVFLKKHFWSAFLGYWCLLSLNHLLLLLVFYNKLVRFGFTLVAFIKRIMLRAHWVRVNIQLPFLDLIDNLDGILSFKLSRCFLFDRHFF